MKYTLEYLKNNKVAVNCKTLEELQKVMDIIKIKWGETASDIFSVAKENTTIEYSMRAWGYADIEFSTLVSCLSIISASEFLKDWEDESKVTDNATTIAAIRTHLAEIDNLLKQIK